MTGHKPGVTIYYCAGCRASTRHSVSEATATCLRCGVVKQPVSNPKPPGAWEQERPPLWTQ